jgi:hypothetical protein
VAGRVLLIRHPLQDPLLDEPGEALIQDVAGDSKAGLEIVKAPDPEEDVAQDEQ